jgi:hypothetical protein
MSNFNEFLKVVAEGKKNTPSARAKHIEEEVKEKVKGDLSSLFEQLASVKTPQHVTPSEEVPNIELTETKEEISEPVLQEVTLPTPIGKVPDEAQIPELDKYLKPTKVAEPEAPLSNEFRQVNDKIKFLERWLSQIQNTGPGSGEVNFRYLDDVNRSSIDKDRQLMYDPISKKFLFVDTRVSIEAYDLSLNIPLLTTPQLLKPSSFINSKNVTYDPATGIFTFLTQCEITLALTVNALASASNQRVYQYAERNTGSGWVPIQNSGKSFQLTNTQHTQIVNSQTISRQAGEQIRYYIYASQADKTSLITETLINTNGSAVYVPAIRIQYSGR